MIIGIDFDGTCCVHEYPEIGRDIGAIPVLKELVDKEHLLILWTIRQGRELEEAVEWFENNKIPLYGINKNPMQKTWNTSPKLYCKLLIDDIGLGIPLCKGLTGERPFVDWGKVRELLIEKGIL